MKKLISALIAACLVCAVGFTACSCNGEPPEHTHGFVQSSITEPDCYNKGYTAYVCECGATRKGDYTDALGHNIVDNACTRCNFKVHVHDYEKTVVPSTCTEKGYTLGHCLTCGANFTAYFTEPLGHDIVNGHCTRCDYFVHEHDYEATVTAPTCTEKGFTAGVCKICGESATFDYTDPLGHDYAEGVCTRCGDIPETEGLAYGLSADGSYYICTGKGTATANYIKIPEAYNGKPVKAIGDQAFAQSFAYNITIPYGITRIGNRAFESCSNLTDITLPSGITAIGDFAFSSCHKLKSITLPASLVSIGESALGTCSYISEIYYNGYVEQWNSISKGNNWNESIYRGYMIYCIDGDITGNSGLVTDTTDYLSFSLSADGSYYICDGMSDALSYFIIPAEYNGKPVKSIGEGAFKLNTDIKSIRIPEGITEIGESSFMYCSKLSSLRIPQSVTKIGNNAFYFCTGIRDITYGGTKAQWTSIKKDNCLDYYAKNYVVHCTDGDIVKSTTINR